MKLSPYVAKEDETQEIPDSERLYEKLKGMVITAVPEYQTSTWARDFDRRLKPEDIPILLLKVQGWTIGEIAEHIQKKPSYVSRVLRSPAGQQLLRKMYTEAAEVFDPKEELKAALPLAVSTLNDVMENSGKDELRLKAAFSVLDRMGYGASKQVTVDHTHNVKVNKNDLQDLTQALKESVEVEDADFEIVAPEPADEQK